MNIINITILYTTLIILLSTLCVLYVIFIYKKKQARNINALNIEKINLYNERLKIETEIKEQTLAYISREIHDNICLSLTLAKLYLNTYYSSEKKEIDTIHNSIDLISKSLSDLNDLSKSVDGEIISKYGIIHSIEIEISKIKKTNLIDIEFKVNGEINYMNSDCELMIFRIIQECLNNILKHSKASKASIKFDYHESFMRIIIEDNGIGFSKEFFEINKVTSGIKNIKKRTHYIKGDIQIQSEISKGTLITISIPYNSNRVT